MEKMGQRGKEGGGEGRGRKICEMGKRWGKCKGGGKHQHLRNAAE